MARIDNKDIFKMCNDSGVRKCPAFLHTLFMSPSFVIYKNGFSRCALAMNYLLVYLSFTTGLKHFKDLQLTIAVDKGV